MLGMMREGKRWKREKGAEKSVQRTTHKKKIRLYEERKTGEMQTEGRKKIKEMGGESRGVAAKAPRGKRNAAIYSAARHKPRKTATGETGEGKQTPRTKA